VDQRDERKRSIRGQPGNWEEPGTFCVGFRLQGLKRKADRSGVNREVHARF
jgi:hypothetical protein